MALERGSGVAGGHSRGRGGVVLEREQPRRPAATAVRRAMAGGGTMGSAGFCFFLFFSKSITEVGNKPPLLMLIYIDNMLEAIRGARL